jgi:hypothetical protein
MKRRVRVSVVFAASAGTLETLEGPVGYQADDAIVTGVANERWPVPRARFIEKYRPVGDVAPGEDGAYESLPQRGWALQVDESGVPPEIVTSAGAVLRSRVGDWLVQDDPTDVRVVNGDLFHELYEELD